MRKPHVFDCGNCSGSGLTGLGIVVARETVFVVEGPCWIFPPFSVTRCPNMNSVHRLCHPRRLKPVHAFFFAFFLSAMALTSFLRGDIPIAQAGETKSWSIYAVKKGTRWGRLLFTTRFPSRRCESGTSCPATGFLEDSACG